MSGRAVRPDVPSRLVPAAVVGLGALVRLGVAAALPLFPDETYYWDWSRHLAAGYFDHPPAVAVLIRAGTLALGDTRLGVRLGTVLAGVVATWALASLARRLTGVAREQGGEVGPGEPGGRSAVRAALLATCIPVALVGFVLATPDAPFLAAVAVTLVALDRALAARARSGGTVGWWCAAGVALGAALCAKYTAVLVPLGVFVAMLVHPRLRARLAEPGPYVAAVIAVAMFLPVVAWNAGHGWVSFVFQFRHGLGAPKGSPLSRELSLVGGQLGLVSPILGVMTVAAVLRTLRHGMSGGPSGDAGEQHSGGWRSHARAAAGIGKADRRFVLAAIAAVVFVFFMLSALRKPVEANWPAPALVAALPLVATGHRGETGRRWFAGGVGVAAACTAVMVVHALLGVLPLPPRRDPVAKAYGWEQAAGRVDLVRDTAVAGGTCAHVWVTADRYQDASELAFHLRARPTVFSLNIGGRPNQYALWPALGTVVRPTDCVLLLVDDTPQGAHIARSRIADLGRAYDLGPVSLSRDGRPVGGRRLWLLTR